MSKNKTRTKDKYRVVYNDTQRIELENEFRLNEYIAIPRKQEIAQKLQLSERQIKIWFQNRRAKKRKQLKRRVGATTSINSSNTSTSSNHNNSSSINRATSAVAQGATATTILGSNAQSNSASPTGIKCEWPEGLMQPISATSADHQISLQQHLNHNATQEHLSQSVISRQQQVNAAVVSSTLRRSTTQQQQIDSATFHHQHHHPLSANRYLQNQSSNEIDMHQHQHHHHHQQQQHALTIQQHQQAQPQSQQQSIINSNNNNSNQLPPLTSSTTTTSSPPTNHLPLSHVQPSNSPYSSTTQPGFLSDTTEQQQAINGPVGHIQSHHHHQQQQQNQSQQHHLNIHQQQQHHYAATQHQQHQQHHQHHQTHPQHMMYCNPQHHHNQMLQVGLATHHAWRQFHASTPQQAQAQTLQQQDHIHVSPPMQTVVAGTPSPQQIHHHQQSRIQSPSFVSHLPQQQQQAAVAAATQMQHPHHYWYQHQHHHSSNYVPIGTSPMQEIVETL